MSTSPSPQSPDEIARTSADTMYASDPCVRALGIELLDVRAGYARMRMVVRPDFLNSHRTCHGGMIFALADSAFAYACNSYGIATVAAGCSIEYLKPVAADELLTAEATEQALAGRQGVYDICVTNRAGDTVAVFRGKSAQIRSGAFSTPSATAH
jgi:acyl-CoA thioesterase